MTGTIVDAILVRAAHDANAAALVDDRRSLSFGELAARARQLAQGLAIGAGDRVVLCADNSMESIVAMFAVWTAHAVLVPVAPRDPDARLQRICAVARPKVILTDRRRSIGAGAPELALAEAINLGVGVPVREPDLPSGARPESAYVIFTSGSTGEPKGVVVSHQAFSHALQAAADVMGFGSATRSLTLLPMYFDGSFSGVFPVLARGGAVYVHRGPVCQPADFFRAFTNHGLTHVTMTPTYLRLLMDSPEWQDSPACSTWTTLALGGEVPPKAAIRRLWERLPDVKVFNRYGPTESTMAVSTLQITPDMLESEASIPIGVPHRGVDFRVIDSSGAPIEDGRPGELYIGGAQLMLGYLDDPAATAEVLAAQMRRCCQARRAGPIRIRRAGRQRREAKRSARRAGGNRRRALFDPRGGGSRVRQGAPVERGYGSNRVRERSSGGARRSHPSTGAPSEPASDDGAGRIPLRGLFSTRPRRKGGSTRAPGVHRCSLSVARGLARRRRKGTHGRLRAPCEVHRRIVGAPGSPAVNTAKRRPSSDRPVWVRKDQGPLVDVEAALALALAEERERERAMRPIRPPTP
jgi:acyl-CoA synthetase (AMP-forming)/AMP-acid ligase II